MRGCGGVCRGGMSISALTTAVTGAVRAPRLSEPVARHLFTSAASSAPFLSSRPLSFLLRASPVPLSAFVSSPLSSSSSPSFPYVRWFHNPRRVRGVGPRPDQLSRRLRQAQAERRLRAAAQRLRGHVPLHSPVQTALPPLTSLPPRPLSHDLVPYTPTPVPLSLPVFDLRGGSFVGEEVPLPPLLFSAPLRLDILHRVVEWQRAGQRQGTAKTKSRGEVSGTGKKPHPQKGTGAARQGTKRAPHHRGGGVAHGKTPRDFSTDLPKKVRALGLRVALTLKHRQGHVHLLHSAALTEHKTRALRQRMDEMGVRDFLLVHGDGELDSNLALAGRNLQHCDFLPAKGANVLSLLRHPTLLLTLQALTELEQRVRRTMIRQSKVHILPLTQGHSTVGLGAEDSTAAVTVAPAAVTLAQ